jgi:hypothetical protein
MLPIRVSYNPPRRGGVPPFVRRKSMPVNALHQKRPSRCPVSCPEPRHPVFAILLSKYAFSPPTDTTHRGYPRQPLIPRPPSPGIPLAPPATIPALPRPSQDPLTPPHSPSHTHPLTFTAPPPFSPPSAPPHAPSPIPQPYTPHPLITPVFIALYQHPPLGMLAPPSQGNPLSLSPPTPAGARGLPPHVRLA